MSQKFLTAIDLAKNELQNAVIQNLASAPSSPVAGQKYYDTTLQKEMYYNGTSWIDATARANHSGTQLASTISNFDAQVRTSRLDQLAAPTAAVPLNSQNITGLADPVNPQDAATKNYTDLLSQGIKDQKLPMRVIATSNLTLSGTQTIDSVACVVGDRVYANNQTTGSQNGAYVVASGAWTRATDMAAGSQLVEGTVFLVNEGTVNAGTQWRCTNTTAITIGTTTITFVQFGQGTVYSGGNGVTLTGTVFSANTGNGLITDGTNTHIDPAKVAQKYSVQIGDNSTLSFTVNHALNNQWATVQIFATATPFQQVFPDVQLQDANNAKVIFNTAPTTNQYRVIVTS